MRRLVPLVLLAGSALAQQKKDAETKEPTPSASGGPSASVPSTPPRPMAGYSFGGGKAAEQPAPRVFKAPAKATSGPVVTLPGFEMLGDGGSRVFVQLTQRVNVEERKAKGSITYVLKGARVTVHNNTNPLVTVHFNTPVSEARVRQLGNDVLLVIDLRSAANPAWTIEAAKDGAAILQVDFPKGSFVPGAPEKGKG